jgi:hypothetical protein
MRRTIDLVTEEARERTLHLVDLENLIGDPRASADETEEAFDCYCRIAGWLPGDLLYVAANPGMVEKIAWCTHPAWSLHAATGRDGADLALLAQCAGVRRRARSASRDRIG